MRTLKLEVCNGLENWGLYDPALHKKGELFVRALCFVQYRNHHENTCWCDACGGSVHVACAEGAGTYHRFRCAACARTD